MLAELKKGCDAGNGQGGQNGNPGKANAEKPPVSNKREVSGKGKGKAKARKRAAEPNEEPPAATHRVTGKKRPKN